MWNHTVLYIKRHPCRKESFSKDILFYIFRPAFFTTLIVNKAPHSFNNNKAPNSFNNNKAPHSFNNKLKRHTGT